MTMHTVDIDRIVLTDLEVTPDQAERVRALVEVELQRLLERQGWPDSLASGEVPRMEAAAMHLAEPPSDRHLVSGLAQRIAQALQDVR